MGRDYEAAIMSGGFCGFMLGTTANAVACMSVLTQKYGPAPPRIHRGAPGRRVFDRLHERDNHQRDDQFSALSMLHCVCCGGCSSAGRALDCGSSGRGFEPLQPPQFRRFFLNSVPVADGHFVFD